MSDFSIFLGVVLLEHGQYENMRNTTQGKLTKKYSQRAVSKIALNMTVPQTVL